MNLIPDTYAGVAINDGSSFSARLSGDGHLNQIAVDPVFSLRAGADPLLSLTRRHEKTLSLMVEMKGNAYSQVDTLNRLFDVRGGEAQLVVKDADDGDREWYLQAQPVSVKVSGALYIVSLRAAFGKYRSVTAHTQTWSLTGTGEAHALATQPVGNANALPVLTFKPTAAKSGGYLYRRLCLITNPTDDTITDALDITDGGLDTASLLADTSVSNQIDEPGDIDDSVTTIAIDTAVGGGLPVSGIGYVDTEQISWTGNSGTQLTGVTRGINGTTAAAHLNNAVIARSKVNADGSDLRVIADNLEVPYWFGTGANAFNTAATRIFANFSLLPRAVLSIKGAISDVGSVTSIAYQATGAAKAYAQSLPQAGRILIDNEVFHYTAVDTNSHVLTVDARAINDTAAAAHSDGAALAWLQQELWLVYGDPTAGAPSYDDDLKPIMALTSTNGSHVYASFTDNAGRRMGQWAGTVLSSKGSETKTYTADHETDADPADDMGISIRSYEYKTKWSAENAEVVWQIAKRQGVTAITATGAKYRTSSSWPKATFEASKDGRHWKVIWTEATPASASSWSALDTHSAVALGDTYAFLRFRMSGSVVGGASYVADMEIDDLTLTLDSARVPVVALGSESTTTYDLDVKVTNTCNGQHFTLRRIVKINQSLRVDCTTRTVTYLEDNSLGPLADRPAGQIEWLELVPGQTNVLQVDEAGLVGLDLTCAFEDVTL